MTPPQTIHHADFELSDDERTILDAFSTFFARECPPARVRDAEPDGFDPDLWKQLAEMRVVAMGVGEDDGGDGAGLVDLCLLAEQWGRHLAPVPVAEAIVAARLLAAAARLGTPSEYLTGALDGAQTVTIALHPTTAGTRQLVPSAGVADAIVALVDDRLVVAPIGERLPIVANQGRTPLAWFDPAAGPTIELAGGDPARAAFAAARRDWQLLMAAALTGMADATLELAVDHARERIAFGVPIGSFQAVAHPLVDVAMNTEMSRRVTRKAAWWADHDPGAHRELIPMAYRFGEHTAADATTVGVHTLGGVGFTVESDVQLYFRRAKGWTLVGGDPNRALDEVADELFGVARPAHPTGQEPT